MGNLRGIHLIAGILGIIAFVLTGQYMELWHAHLGGMADGPRLMYRSAHIYVLYGALLNVLLGVYLQLATGSVGRRLQLAGSLMVLAVPVLLLVSFLIESQNNPLSRPIGVIAIYLSLLAVALHLFAARSIRRN